MKKEMIEKLGKAAVKAAQEMLASLPDDARYVEGTLVLSGKEVKKRFETDEEFAAKIVERVVGLKLDTMLRKPP